MIQTIASLWLFLVLCAGCSRTPSRATPEPLHLGNASSAAGDIDRTAIHDRLAQKRAHQIAELTTYAARAEFPHNLAQPTGTHIFRDDAGRLCAVANLVHRDGHDDLVEVTAREHNDLAMADVHDGPMLEWILTSGLTQEEIVRIQIPAPSLMHIEPIHPSAPMPVAANDRSTEARMNETVAKHIEQVRDELFAHTGQSLEIATERFLTHGASGSLSLRDGTKASELN
jgi:hypothetical protein